MHSLGERKTQQINIDYNIANKIYQSEDSLILMRKAKVPKMMTSSIPP